MWTQSWGIFLSCLICLLLWFCSVEEFRVALSPTSKCECLAFGRKPECPGRPPTDTGRTRQLQRIAWCVTTRESVSQNNNIHPSCYPSILVAPALDSLWKSILIVRDSSEGTSLQFIFPVELWRRSTPLGYNEIASPWIINYFWEFSAPGWKCQPSS